MKIKEILKKVDTYNEIAKDFGRDTIHVFVEFDEYTQYAATDSKDFFKYLKEEWTKEFIEYFTTAEFKLTGCGDFTKFEADFTVNHSMYGYKNEEYHITVIIDED